MFRDPKIAANVAKPRRDTIIAEAVGDATRWLPIQPHQRAVITIAPGQRQTATVTHNGVGSSFDEAIYPGYGGGSTTYEYAESLDPTVNGIDADIVVESKFGGERDDEAAVMDIQQFVGTPGSYMNIASVTGRQGFIRMRCSRHVTDVKLDVQIINAPEVQ